MPTVQLKVFTAWRRLCTWSLGNTFAFYSDNLKSLSNEAFARYHRHSSGNDNGSLIPGMARRGHRSPLTFITLIKHFKKIKTFQKNSQRAPMRHRFPGGTSDQTGVFFFLLSQVENFVLYLERLRGGRVPRCGKTRRHRAWLNLGRQRRRCHLKYNVRRSISAAANFIPANDNDLLWWSICSFAYLFVPHASLPPVEKGRLRDPLGTFEKKRRWEEGKKTFKRWWVFFRRKVDGRLE